ncbi:MAG TPA: PGPGW domain-containing protein [Planctomycetaceae bacterium]|jgi:uncharacterized protein (TIGR02611 family)|nr:PGPGW domain-containing protein [Planctomycetaceae bacterium]
MQRPESRLLRLVWRLGVLVVGTILLVAGVIMIVTPGPAIVLIPLSLGVLATEFPWARTVLRKARPMIDRMVERARRRRPQSS